MKHSLIKKNSLVLLSLFVFVFCNKDKLSSETMNHPPVANAGQGETVILPVTGIFLDAINSTDQDNNIQTYEWVQKAGPLAATIVTPDEAKTQVIGLVDGVYKFELIVTDAGGSVSYDNIEIKVLLPARTSEIIFEDEVLVNQCYDDQPGACAVNSDSPSYGLFIKDVSNALPDTAMPIVSVLIKLDTSTVWEQVPANCLGYDPYPQSDFTYCYGTEGLSVSSWFLTIENLAGRKADVKILFKEAL
jgi:hypothetical protein